MEHENPREELRIFIEKAATSAAFIRARNTIGLPARGPDTCPLARACSLYVGELFWPFWDDPEGELEIFVKAIAADAEVWSPQRWRDDEVAFRETLAAAGLVMAGVRKHTPSRFSDAFEIIARQADASLSSRWKEPYYFGFRTDIEPASITRIADVLAMTLTSEGISAGHWI